MKEFECPRKLGVSCSTREGNDGKKCTDWERRETKAQFTVRESFGKEIRCFSQGDNETKTKKKTDRRDGFVFDVPVVVVYRRKGNIGITV